MTPQAAGRYDVSAPMVAGGVVLLGASVLVLRLRTAERAFRAERAART